MIRGRIGYLACALALATVRPGRSALADDKTAAIVAYDRAKQLVQQGNYTDACPLFDASYRADPQLGVLLNLADCHEHVGRTASAWAEFRDAKELAHKSSDKREAYAQTRADALVPKLAKLRIAVPKVSVPGLAVFRDQTDVTVLVGTDMPIDLGVHELVVSAPGYLPWQTKVTINAPGVTTPLEIPKLEPQPVAVTPPVVPEVHEGTITVTTKPGAEILIDTKRVGVGTYTGTLGTGGHTLRVVAPGMHVYQAEIVVSDHEQRTIDVPLEAEVVFRPGVIEHPASGPSFEVGLSIAPGEKGHGDRPEVIAYRLELALRLGRRVNLGVFVDAATISASGACGTDIPGPTPATPFDFGAHNQFNGCRYFMPGLQLYVHILPQRRIDPYLGVAPGFRLGFVDYTSYNAAGSMTTKSTQFLPGIAVGLRAGVDYHPTTALPGWEVGAFFDGQVMVVGQENFDDSSGDKGTSYFSLFGGLRTTLQF